VLNNTLDVRTAV